MGFAVTALVLNCVNVSTPRRSRHCDRWSRFCHLAWSLATIIGNALPPRDPNDDETSDEEDDEQDEDLDPAVIREPDE
jgi:hypothetical protein